MTKRETATILAALRLWQQEGIPTGAFPDHFDEPGLSPLNFDEIDALCERLNFGGQGGTNT